MQVKRFFAADMRQAMKLVREALGPDATIIGNRRVAGGIELTAALDFPLAEAPPEQPNAELEAELRKTQSKIAEAHAELSAPAVKIGNRQILGETPAERPVPAPAASAAASTPGEMAGAQQAFDVVRSELSGLRELIEMQLGSFAWSHLRTSQPQQAGLWRRLQRIGLPAEICRELLGKVGEISDPKQAWRMLLAHLAQSVKVARSEPLDAGGVIALVGPAGAGKTTTLAKLAARYVLQHGAEHLALVTLDNYRIGAQEQLKTLGRILDVPVLQVDPEQSLLRALAPLSRKRIVLVDTAGLPASNPVLKKQLEALASPALRSKNYLVLAATSQSQVLKAAWHSYKHCGLAGCIMTKLDEAGSLGELLGLAISQQLPVAYLADGPGIPDDLHLPRSHQLVSRAVSLQMAEEPSEEAMADLFAGLYNEASRRAG